jgi:hypothetical protein
MTPTSENDPTKFLQALSVLVAASIALTAVINYIVDPYGIYHSISVRGFNAVKPQLGTHGRLFKAAEVMRLQSEAIILGSSRAATGLNPAHTGFPANAYNLAIDGSDMHEVLAYFRHALANQPNVKLVVFGVDPEMFAAGIPQSDFDESRIGRRHLHLTDIANSLITIDALKASIETVIANVTHRAIPYYHESGQRTETAWLQASCETRWKPAPTPVGKFTLSERKIEEFRELVQTCNQHQIKLILFFSPTHVRYNEHQWSDLNWPVLINCKTALVSLAPIYDFSGYNSVTSETQACTMKYYIDASHYTERTGNMILSKLFGISDSGIPPDFGHLWSKDNLPQMLENMNDERQRWQSAHSMR